jgi:hypothetical protein
LPFLISLGAHTLLLPLILFVPAHADLPETSRTAIDTSVLRPEPRLTLAFVVQASGDETSEPPPQLSPSPPQPAREAESAITVIPSMVQAPALTSGAPPEPTADMGHELKGGMSSSAANGPPGIPAPPSFLSLAERAQSVVYVIDRSTSMGLSGAWDVARQWVLASLATLPRSAQFQVIYYDKWARPLCGAGGYELVPATLENLRQASDRLEALPAAGGTKHVPALTAAVKLNPELVFLLTDGEEITEEEVRTITRCNRRTALHVLELTTTDQNKGGGPLAALARTNRGKWQPINITH